MNKNGNMTFKQSDDFLKILITERHQQLVNLQKSQSDQLMNVETRGQDKILVLKKTMPKEIVDVFDSLDKMDKDTEKFSTSHIECDGNTTDIDNTQLLDCRAIPSTLYYIYAFGTGGTSFNSYDSNITRMLCTAAANGRGSGIGGNGSAKANLYLDWYFRFVPPETRMYSFNINVPLHGFYRVFSDDGMFSSKKAEVSINMSARARQYNTKDIGTSSTNVLYISNDNINVETRFDRSPNMNCAAILGGGDEAFLVVTVALDVYARGGSSTGRLNFSEGTANYLGKPEVYIF